MNDKTERQLREIEELKDNLKKITGDILHDATRVQDPELLGRYREALIGLNNQIALCVPQVLWHENAMRDKFSMKRTDHITWADLLLK